jgi:hypothetical protein
VLRYAQRSMFRHILAEGDQPENVSGLPYLAALQQRAPFRTSSCSSSPQSYFSFTNYPLDLKT